MNAFEQLNRIEQAVGSTLQHVGRAEMQAGLDVNLMDLASGMQFSSGQVGGWPYSVWWDQHGPFSMERDSDHDGIPDAIDFYDGPGAFPPGSHSPM